MFLGYTGEGGKKRVVDGEEGGGKRGGCFEGRTMNFVSVCQQKEDGGKITLQKPTAAKRGRKIHFTPEGGKCR